jgi:hypothetical protein
MRFGTSLRKMGTYSQFTSGSFTNSRMLDPVNRFRVLHVHAT